METSPSSLCMSEHSRFLVEAQDDLNNIRQRSFYDFHLGGLLEDSTIHHKGSVRQGVVKVCIFSVGNVSQAYEDTRWECTPFSRDPALSVLESLDSRVYDREER